MDAFDQRMRREEFGQAAPQCAGTVAVNNAHLRLTGQRGAINFARLVHIAEGIKIELTGSDHVERYAAERAGIKCASAG